MVDVFHQLKLTDQSKQINVHALQQWVGFDTDMVIEMTMEV